MEKETNNHNKIDIARNYIMGTKRDFERNGSCPLFNSSQYNIILRSKRCEQVIACASTRECDVYEITKIAKSKYYNLKK